MIPGCLICKEPISGGAPDFSFGDRRKGLAGKWNLFECKNCGIISIIPLPSDGQLTEYYSVYSKDASVTFLKRAGSRFPFLRRMYHRLSGDVDPRDFVEIPEGARVLDYGCGHGSYLADFQARGVNISGAEIAENLVEACCAHGFDVRRVEHPDRIPFDDNEFHVVYLMQVFEHLRDPSGFMQELNRVLKPGGTLYIAVPNKKSVWRKVFGKNWVSGWFAPFHLFHYDHTTLSLIARRHGFDPIRFWSNTPDSWFRLNLKAFFYPKDNSLDWHPSWLDTRLARYSIMLVLLILELPIRERDCLVMKLEKRG
jgi:SAM-dependent methyltransferase